MPPHRNYQRSKESSTKQPCRYCGNLYLLQGIKRHEGSCVKELQNHEEWVKHNKAYIQDVHQGSPTSFAPDEDDMLMGMADPCGRDSDVSITAHVMGRLVNSTAPDAANVHPPDFKTKFHPCKFSKQNLECMPPDCEPWCPFASEGDCIFALIAMEAGLSSNQVDSLLKLVHCISQGTASVMLCNDAGLHTALDRAAVQLTLFSKFEITAPYKGNDVTFPIHIHPLWDWALNLLQNSSLAPHFIWDGQQLFKHDGDHWWDIQMWLSSHGTVKGHPVIAHCVNLPVHVHNGEQYGGGCIVGWLLIVPELAKEEGKTGYANFKHVIWHTAFFQLLKKVVELSKVLHWLFPLVLILSANYEELCVMTLIQGTKSKCPCPFCLVPLEQLWDLKKTYEMHTTEQHKRVLALFEEKKMVGEKKLKSLGLCPVKNTFWSVEHSEPEQAASFELLHSLHGGMGGKHIHGELRIVVSELGHDSKTRLEAQISPGNYSAWPNENMHGPLKDTYQDRSNGKDIAGQILHVDHHRLATKLIQACIDAENKHVNNATNNNKDHNTNTNQNDWAFDGFCQKLETFLNTCLLTYGFPLDKWIQLQGTHTTYPHSSEDPGVSIFEGPVCFNGGLGVFEDTFQFALVQPLTARTGVCRLDQDLRLVRVKAVSRAASIFIPVKSIIRGTLLYPDLSHHGKFLQYFRVRAIRQSWRVTVRMNVGVTAWHCNDGRVNEMMSKVMPHTALTPRTTLLILRSFKNGIKSCMNHLEMLVLPSYAFLLSTLPQNHKRAVENNPNTILDNNIAAQAKKYCFFYHFWVPKDVFLLMIPPPGYNLNNPARWSMPESKIIGLKVELDSMLPSDLKACTTTYSNFGHVFSNVVGAERPNILKPIKDNTQQLFVHLGLRSNEDVKALLKMHPGSIGTRYTPLSLILFPKPDALVARDLFKSQLLVNIIHVMVFGKGILTGKQRGGLQGQGQKLGISGTLAGLIAIAATFAWYLLLSDSPTWESNILSQLNSPQWPTPPSHTPTPDLSFNPNPASTSHHMPEAAQDSLVVISQTSSVSSALLVDVTNLSLGGAVVGAMQTPPAVIAQELPTKECCITQHRVKGFGTSSLNGPISLSSQLPLLKKYHPMFHAGDISGKEVAIKLKSIKAKHPQFVHKYTSHSLSQFHPSQHKAAQSPDGDQEMSNQACHDYWHFPALQLAQGKPC
ncbi:hypothetical protein BKA82DRAFT_4010622 [Pisolithus tinctorius]|nr:hypothetical protein BKA82DRAFT_4010622 [Pisolithus tinctorius]